MIEFGSVCSGIEAASVSWEVLGWKAVWLAEIDPFASAVLAHHWPRVPNLGDMTTIIARLRSGEVKAPSVFCGGTPCQAFSVAGSRLSLGDARGNLSLTFCEIANAIDDIRHARGEPASVVFWENVPGCLNTHDNAFGCFLAGLAGDESALEPGPRPEPNRSSAYWSWKKESGQHVPSWPNAGCVVGPRRAVAWRVLDAQHFGLAQRRKRVFVVASALEGFNPAEVLFEFDGVRRDSPPSRETREEATYDVAPCLTSGGRGVERTGDPRGQDPIVAVKTLCLAHGQGNAEIGEDRSPTLTCNHEAPIAVYSSNGIGSFREGVGPLRARPQDSHENLAISVHGTQDPIVGYERAHALGCNNGAENAVLAFRACGQEGFTPSDVSPPILASDGGGAGVPTVAYAFAENSRGEIRLEGGNGQVVGRLSTGGGKAGQGVPAIAFSCKDYGADAAEDLAPTLRAMGHAKSHANAGGQLAVCVTGDVTHTLTAEGFDASEDGTGRGQPIIPSISFCDAISPTLRAGGNVTGGDRPPGSDVDTVTSNIVVKDAAQHMRVRRLMPLECARLQGFPDNHCQIPWRNKPESECPDGPQYKAYGNSWAVYVTRWIGMRIHVRLEELGVTA